MLGYDASVLFSFPACGKPHAEKAARRVWEVIEEALDMEFGNTVILRPYAVLSERCAEAAKHDA